MWGRQWSGDPGEQAVHGWTRRQRAVYSQSVPHWYAHTQLVSVNIAQGSSASWRGIVECISLYQDEVKLNQNGQRCFPTSGRGFDAVASLTSPVISFRENVALSPEILTLCFISEASALPGLTACELENLWLAALKCELFCPSKHGKSWIVFI